jgi:hypothetical protein
MWNPFHRRITIAVAPTPSGYQALDPEQIAKVNAIRAVEITVGQLQRGMASDTADPRWAAIARTHFDQGFMALIRAVTKSADPV